VRVAARRISKTDIKVVVPQGYAFDRTVTRRGFSALSTHLRIPFFQKIFLQKNFCTVGQFAGVRLKASGMAITGTGGRTKEMIEVWKLIKSLR
jgi:hypothetical protein